MKRYSPDPSAAVTALAGRLDILERHLADLDELRIDVTALSRGVTDVATQLRHLADSIYAPAATTGQADDAVEEDDAEDGQPDWLTITDPGTAASWLVGIERWARQILVPLGAAPTVACWPLHPDVVAELLALQAEHVASYANPRPTAVSEWFARWLPGTTTRIGQRLDQCSRDRAHWQHERTYEIPQLNLPLVARWWAETHGHHPDAVEAFALIPAN